MRRVENLCRTAAAIALLAPAAALGDSSIRCAGGIVSVGDSKADLLGKCGPPALQERSTEETWQLDVKGGVGQGVVVPVERWTYDLGRNRFVQVVKIVAGKVSDVERGGHGYAEEPLSPPRPKKATCDPAVLGEGKLKVEILARCGAPSAIDALEEERRTIRKVDGATVQGEAVTVRIELWTYDFGPNQFLRFVRFEDGKVTRVETGSYGYGE